MSWLRAESSAQSDAADETTLIRVRLTPRASKNAIGPLVGEGDQVHLQVWVRAAPTDGSANAALLELLSDTLGVPKSRLRLVRGHTAREKTVRVEGLSPAAVRAKLGLF